MQVLHGDAVLDELLVSFQIKACLHSCLDFVDYEVNSFLFKLKLILSLNDQDCTILSGDVIIRHLAQLLTPKYVVFLVLLPSLLYSFKSFLLSMEDGLYTVFFNCLYCLPCDTDSLLCYPLLPFIYFKCSIHFFL